MARLPRDKASLAALLVSLAIFLIGATVGYLALSGVELFATSDADQSAATGFDGSLSGILGRNLGAIMLMYSGAVTLGLTSLLGLGMLSAYVGATLAVGVGNVGLARIAGDTGLYAPIEFLGCIVAAAAGLYPVLAVIGAIFAENGRARLVGTYFEAVLGSLKIFAAAVALILTAAVIEAILIATR